MDSYILAAIEKKKYLVIYRYYHQMEYRNGVEYFTNKKEMEKFIRNMGNEETFVASYKLNFRRIK